MISYNAAGMDRIPVLAGGREFDSLLSRCAGEDVELHLFSDGDHRLTDRKERLWDLMMEFLRGRRLGI